MRASVVVPTYKRPELLGRCLSALGQLDTDFLYEIIVVDNACDEETRQVVKYAAAYTDIPLRYLAAAAKRGPAHARNVGWNAARGEIIAFTDDDTIPENYWLARGVARLENDRTLAAVSGNTIVPLPRDPTDYALNESGLASGEFITANCFCRRVALRALDGFDEQFTAAWREDSDLQFRMQEIGFRVGRAEDAVVLHPVRPAGFGVSLRQQRKAMLDALLFKKHPRRFREKIGFFAARYYAMVTALVAAIIFALLGYWTAASLFFVAWAVLTAWFCYQRLRGTSHSPRHVAEMVVTSLLIPPAAIFWRVYGAVKFRVLFF